MSLEKHEALVTQTDADPLAAQPPLCPIAKIQETSSVLSGEVGSLATSTPSHQTDFTYHSSPARAGSIDQVRKARTASLKIADDDISVWSDTLSVMMMHNPHSTDSISEERKSLLEARSLSADRRYSSSVGSGILATSPRPGSRSPRRSRRSRRERNSQRSRRGSTRGEVLMEMARHDSGKSRERNKSSSSYRDSVREKNASIKKNQRKNSDSTTSSSSASLDEDGGAKGKGLPGKGKRGFMTARDAVELGDMFCGCFLKDKFFYFLKPFIFLVFGTILIAGGLALTVLHFMYEDSLVQKNPPFFTYGPITLSTGVILFMVGLVWIPIKQQKWSDGMASPMLAALEKWRLEQGDLEMKPIGMFISRLHSTTVPQTDETKSIEGQDENGDDKMADRADEAV